MKSFKQKKGASVPSLMERCLVFLQKDAIIRYCEHPKKGTLCLLTEDVKQGDIVFAVDGPGAQEIYFKERTFPLTVSTFQKTIQDDNITPVLIPVYNENTGFQDKLFFLAGTDLDKGAILSYDFRKTGPERASTSESQVRNIITILFNKPSNIIKPCFSHQDSGFVKGKTSGAARCLFLDSEAQVSGSDSGDESPSELSDEPCEPQEEEEQHVMAAHVMAEAYATYPYNYKLFLIRMFYDMCDSSSQHEFLQMVKMTEFAGISQLLIVPPTCSSTQYQVAKAVFHELSELQMPGESFWQCAFRMFMIQDRSVENLTADLEMLDSPSKVAKRAASAPATPQKTKRKPSGSPCDQGPCSSTPVPTATQDNISLLSQSSQAQTPCDMLRDPAGDPRDSMLTFKDKAHLRHGSYPSNRHKMYLCMIPGDHLMCEIQNRETLVEGLPPASMALMCATRNDYFASSSPDSPIVTMLLIKTEKPVTCSALAKNIALLCCPFSVLPNECLLTPLTSGGYVSYYDLMSKDVTCCEVGEIDEATKKKLKLTDGDEVKNAFIKLCDYAEAHNVDPETSQINALFETIPVSAPEHKCITKLRQSASQYKCVVENTKWLLQQRISSQNFALHERSQLLPCMIWSALYEDWNAFCQANDCYSLFPPEPDCPIFQSWMWERVLGAQTEVERILLANGIPPTNYVNAVAQAVHHGTRRQRCIVLYSDKHKCGKSILAGSLMQLLKGKRITLEDSSSRDFVVSFAANAGMVVIEDPSHSALDYIVKSMRAHMDGDAIQINAKHQALTHAQYPPMIVTTNVNNTTQALQSRSVCFTFNKSMEQVFGSRQVDCISHIDMARFLAKYCAIPMCNAIYRDIVPMNPGTIFTQCTNDTLVGHSPFCRFMLYVTRIADKVNVAKRTVFANQLLRNIHSIERIRPLTCGMFTSSETIENSRVCLLIMNKCLAKGDRTGTKIRSEKAPVAYHIERFYANVMKPLSALLYNIITHENNFFSQPCSIPSWLMGPCVRSCASQHFYQAGCDHKEYLGIHNKMTQAEIAVRTQGPDPRGTYHTHITDKLLGFAVNHGLITKVSHDSYSFPTGTELSVLYADCYGKTVQMQLETPIDDARSEEDCFG
ncbi:EO1 [Micropterus dolomieu adomavirus 2]|uniref:EO1 n=1 Tax=Micropterus dolomieu adomavirus 2 TaxID=2681676 RepID=A0A650BV35_9VIRU|nr:EO1 [Micropterus dolomieu adomavirus 2]